jgi:hypothetical protein
MALLDGHSILSPTFSSLPSATFHTAATLVYFRRSFADTLSQEWRVTLIYLTSKHPLFKKGANAMAFGK